MTTEKNNKNGTMNTQTQNDQTGSNGKSCIADLNSFGYFDCYKFDNNKNHKMCHHQQ